MRFDVGFVNQVDAIPVAQIVPARVVGVVAGAHGVDVELFHQLNVLDHGLHSDRVARVGIVLVPVHASEQNRHAVDVYLPVFDLDLPEADLAALDFQNVAGRVLQRDQQCVQVGIFIRPLLWIGYSPLQVQRGLLSCADRNLRHHRLGEHGLPVGVVEHRFHTRARRILLAVVPDLCPDFERGITIGFIEIRPDPKIAHVHTGRGEQVHIPVDAAQPPIVLVFQIAAIRPAVHAHRQRVLAGAEVRRDVKLGGQPASLAVAHHLAVDPEVEG